MFPEVVITDRKAFFCLESNTTYFVFLPKRLRELRLCLLVSPFGWLMVREYMNNEYRTNLLNPLTRVRIQLPSLEKLILQAVLSSSPLSSTSHGNCIIMVINNYENKLMFARPGGDNWTSLQEYGVRKNYYYSIAYFKGQFYALTWGRELWICDVSSPHPKATKLTPPDYVASPRFVWWDAFLVEVADELLLFVKLYDAKFKVLKFDFSTCEWKKLKSLGDYAVFVGARSSFALSASEYPGLIGGCVYFFESFKECHRKIGIYNFNEDKSIESLRPCCDLRYDYHRSIWIRPSWE
ncbi:hypothetical protein GIB67_004925 [Kingdonia uniflora]|uniref:KIB1-4 beta-propeller domain-containing protein n=1 Tax=Kingdonia uniflora TaxID=39325 RepID=A0A7J7LDZ5_9MAGN|nr:hypothetical protein GIB67_042266 [Kingdonia uniflora]KAF6175299.1 hypothetical protein GIB67_004925 [Kingdonia uniflora]